MTCLYVCIYIYTHIQSLSHTHTFIMYVVPCNAVVAHAPAKAHHATEDDAHPPPITHPHMASSHGFAGRRKAIVYVYICKGINYSTFD
jgi:hypothetical protein